MGSHICRELVRRGYSVRIFDKLYTSRALVRDIEPELEIIEGDISRPHDVVSAISDAETLIHLVHTTRPGSSMEDPSFDVASNVVTTAKWLPAVGGTKVRRILFVSSGGTVYGIPRTIPIDEGHVTEPVCAYGISKLAIEKYIAMYAAMFGIKYLLLRPSNVYGEGQRLNVGQGVIGVMANCALRGEPLEIWGSGENLRDYLHVDDMVSAMMSLVEYSGPHSVFNISSGTGNSVLDIVKLLSKSVGFAPDVVRKPDRGFDVPANVLDSSRLQQETGWQPRVTLDRGIGRTIDWLKSRSVNETYELHI